MLNDKLLTHLFDGQPHPLAEPMAAWLDSSRRFSAFVNTFRDKIRKKLRVTQDPETLNDLRLEFETAYLLLRERNLNVMYEPEQSGPGRSPDFAVTYTTSLTFTVEVTRLRRMGKESLPASDNGSSFEGERLADAICSKSRQLLSQRANVLIVGVDSLSLTDAELRAVMLGVKQRAEGSNPAFWQRYGFIDRADFFRHYQRLSELLVRRTQLQVGEPVLAWVNPQAKHPLPGKVRTALYRSQTVEA